MLAAGTRPAIEEDHHHGSTTGKKTGCAQAQGR